MHLKGQGCKKCAIIYKSNLLRKDKELFYTQVNLLHKNKFKYFDDYKGRNHKIKIECPNHGLFYQIASNHLNGQDCKKCSIQNKTKKHEQFVIEANIIHNNFYEYIEEYEHSQKKLKIKCPEHGIFEQEPAAHLSGKGCSTCGKFSSVSKYKLEILNFLEKNNIINIQTSNWKILKQFELDIYLPYYNLAIEINGLYWHSKLYKDNNYHLNKTNECLSKGIRLIHIFEDEWIYKQNIVKSRLLNILKKDIYELDSVDCFIREIDESLAKQFINNNNLYDFENSEKYIGLYYIHKEKEYLVSLMTFTENKINQFCNKINFNIFNAQEKIINYYIEKYKPNNLIIKLDKRWCVENNVYKQLGFEKINELTPKCWFVFAQERLKNNFSGDLNSIYDSGKIILEYEKTK